MKYPVILAALALWGAGASAHEGHEDEVKAVTGQLPGETAFEALDGLAELNDGDVARLDLDMLPLAWPVIIDAEGGETTPQTCEFGMMDGVETVRVPTGANDLKMSVWLGNRADHPANGLSCEVGPVGESDSQQGARLRLTGCYLVRHLSLPAARKLVLNPLPASACGLHG